MFDIVPASPGQPMRARDAKQVAAALSQSYAMTQLRCNGVQDETEVAIEKVDALTHLVGHSMGAIVRVAQVQQHLETLAPAAAGRLNMLADSHTLNLATIQDDLVRALRRR